jgi:hypothetical protein
VEAVNDNGAILWRYLESPLLKTKQPAHREGPMLNISSPPQAQMVVSRLRVRSVVLASGGMVFSRLRVRSVALASGGAAIGLGWLALPPRPIGAACEALPSPHETAAPSSLGRLEGVWQQDKPACESLCPFIAGLGMPGAQYVCPIIDAVSVTLRISCDEHGEAQIVDKTVFGRNVTSFKLDRSEAEVATRGGRKRFMISGWRDGPDAVVTRCRLFQRGEGWETLMARTVLADGRLEETNVLRRPSQPDVTVRRYFTRVSGTEAL